MFVYQETAYVNAEDTDWVAEQEFVKGAMAGKIKNSGVTQEFQDWDATILPVDTEIYETEDAQDLASAVFLSAYRNWEKYDPELASVSTWLYCAARNQLKNYYRNRKPVISLELLMDRGEGNSLLEDARFQCVTEWREVLKHALASLPERNRQVVVLRYYAGKSNRKADKIIGIQEIQEKAQPVCCRRAKSRGRPHEADYPGQGLCNA